jgi:striatin 1/3/4
MANVIHTTNNGLFRHLDSVRSVCFHPDEMIAASGSDDGTVKIWNLQRATGKDGNAAKK